MSDGWGDGYRLRGPRGRCIRHAPEAAPRAVGPLAVPVIKPAFQAALMPRVRLPPLVPLRGRAAARPTVGLPAVAGPTDGKHRPAPRPAAPHRAPRHGSGHRPCTPRRLRRVRRRRGVTGETDRPAWADGGARPGERRSRTHGSRRLRDRRPSRPLGLARVGVKISARAIVASGHSDRLRRCLGVRSLALDRRVPCRWAARHGSSYPGAPRATPARGVPPRARLSASSARRRRRAPSPCAHAPRRLTERRRWSTTCGPRRYPVAHASSCTITTAMISRVMLPPNQSAEFSGDASDTMRPAPPATSSPRVPTAATPITRSPGSPSSGGCIVQPTSANGPTPATTAGATRR